MRRLPAICLCIAFDLAEQGRYGTLGGPIPCTNSSGDV